MSEQTDQMQATRTIDAAPAAVFAVLSDPRRHADTEPSEWGWVRDSVDQMPITEVGQVFAVNMFLDAVGGDYVMHNIVRALQTDREIAWEPGQRQESGEIDTGGWVWRYHLEPVGEDQTRVTLVYDYTAVSQQTRDAIPVGHFPPFGPDYLEGSLARLESAAKG